jgi:hypothetical protein
MGRRFRGKEMKAAVNARSENVAGSGTGVVDGVAILSVSVAKKSPPPIGNRKSAIGLS